MADRTKEHSVQIKAFGSSFSLSHDWSHNSGQSADLLDEVCPSVKQLSILLEALPPRGDMKTDKQTFRAVWPLRYRANLYFSQYSTD